jgi:ribose transport system permease protein
MARTLTIGSGSGAGLRRALAGSSSAPVWAALAVIFVLAALAVGLRGGQFLTVHNVTDILVRSVALGLVAVGQTFVILGGSLDLSVAYVVSVSAVTASVMMAGDPALIPLGVACCLAVGLVVGAVNGLVVTRLGVHPFIATLGMSLVLQGLIYAAVNDFVGAVPVQFQALAYDGVGPVPFAVLLLAAAVAIAWFTLARTRFGFHLYAVGGSAQTARLSGIRSDRVVIAAHVICAVMAAVTGLFIVSRLRSGAPWVGTDGAYDLESIAAVVLGGTVLAGGRGGVLGTVAGVLILAVLDTAFNQLGVDPFLKSVLRGVILIAAVAISALRVARNPA